MAQEPLSAEKENEFFQVLSALVASTVTNYVVEAEVNQHTPYILGDRTYFARHLLLELREKDLLQLEAELSEQRRRETYTITEKGTALYWTLAKKRFAGELPEPQPQPEIVDTPSPIPPFTQQPKGKNTRALKRIAKFLATCLFGFLILVVGGFCLLVVISVYVPKSVLGYIGYSLVFLANFLQELCQHPPVHLHRGHRLWWIPWCLAP